MVADEIAPRRRTGWSVAVTGLAHPVTGPDRIAGYERLLVDQVMDAVIAIPWSAEGLWSLAMRQGSVCRTTRCSISAVRVSVEWTV